MTKSFFIYVSNKTAQLLSSLGMENVRTKKIPTGSLINLDICQKTQFIQWFRSSYEARLLDPVREILRESDIVIDCGGHVGYWTLVFSDLVGEQGKVIVFEPEKNNFQNLLKNIELNQKKNIIPQNAAVSSRSGDAALCLSQNNEGGHFLGTESDRSLGKEIQTVKIMRTDELFKSLNLHKKVRLMKVDTEGHEFEVLKGMSDLIEPHLNPDFVIVESSRFYPETRSEIYELMRNYGYDHVSLQKPFYSSSIHWNLGEEEMLFRAKS